MFVNVALNVLHFPGQCFMTVELAVGTMHKAHETNLDGVFRLASLKSFFKSQYLTALWMAV